MERPVTANSGRMRFFSGLRARLSLLIVLAMLPAVFLVFYMAAEQYRQVRGEARENALGLVRLAAAEHGRRIADARRLLLAAEGLPDLRAVDAARCPPSLSHPLAADSAFSRLFLIDGAGRLVCRWPDTAEAQAPPSAAALARKAIAAGHLLLGDTRFESASGSPVAQVAYPVAVDPGRPAAALVLSLDLSYLGSLIRQGGLPGEAAIDLRDSGGRLLYRYPDPQQWIGRQAADTALAKGIPGQTQEGVTEVAGLDGIPRLYAYAPLAIPETGELLHVHLGVPAAAAYKEPSRVLAVTLAGLAAAFAVVSAFCWLGVNALVVRPIGALAAAARKLGGGDYGARSGIGHAGGEIGALAGAFDEMADNLEERQIMLRSLEEGLRQSAENSRGMTETMATGLILHRGGKSLYANRAASQITGYTRDELLDMEFHELAHPESHAMVLDYGRRRLRGEEVPARYRFRMLTKGGEERWLDLSAALITFNGQKTGIATFIDITEQHLAEAALRQARDELEQQVAQRTAQLSEAMRTLEDDVARRKRAETELLARNAELTELNRKLGEAQSQLMQSDKLASIGQLAAGVAHEINNPIGYVQSNLGSLENYLKDLFEMLDGYAAAETALPEDAAARLRALAERIDLAFLREDVPKLMSESKEGITRVRKIVRDLKDFSRADSGTEWEFADLHKCLDSTLNVVHNEIKYKADVVREYGSLPEVECLPSQMNQVFMNLLVNAAHAMEGPRGTITLRTGAAGGEVWVEIADTGKGIPPENLGRIFDPFFTTKPVGKGTGLGLSLAYGIVQKHGGRIGVASEVGRGTSFRVTIPAQRGEAAKAA